jgi:putative transposase
MKNLLLLDIYYTPEQLSEKIEEWVEYYNNHRYHEAINNATPADRYFGRENDILKYRKKTKEKTLKLRKKLYEKYCQQGLQFSAYGE